MDFGDYCYIEQKRHGAPNEMYQHKVIGRLRSNTWVDVPVQSPATETLHDKIVDVIACICCGVSEREVRRYRVSDCRPAPETFACLGNCGASVIGPNAYCSACLLRERQFSPGEINTRYCTNCGGHYDAHIHTDEASTCPPSEMPADDICPTTGQPHRMPKGQVCLYCHIGNL
jgi:hypothetical protein